MARVEMYSLEISLDMPNLKEKNIAHLINEQHIEKGGAQKIVAALASALPGNSTILAFDYIGLKEKRRTSTYRTLVLIIKLMILKRKNHIFVLHHRCFLPIALALRPQCVFVCHSIFPNKNYIYKFMARMKVIAVSDRVKQHLMHVNPKLNIEVIENGVDLYSSERRISREGDEIIIGFVGRAERVKGYDLLLKAMQIVQDHECAKKIRIVHVGPRIDAENQELSRLEKILKVNVEHLGYMDRPFDALRNASFICIPSRFEGFGLVFYEAFVRGHPIVASDLPVFKDKAELDNSVLFFDAGSPESLAERIDAMIKMQPNRITARERKVDHIYSTTEMVGRYVDYFQCRF